MEDSILTTIKQLVGGVQKDYTHFDTNYITAINTVFMDLWELGVGPSEPFYIEDESAIWTDFISDPGKCEALKSYMQLRVELLFDPPANGSLIAAKERQIEKLEWRLNVAAESVDS